jgi:hypothetical protein
MCPFLTTFSLSAKLVSTFPEIICVRVFLFYSFFLRNYIGRARAPICARNNHRRESMMTGPVPPLEAFSTWCCEGRLARERMMSHVYTNYRWRAKKKKQEKKIVIIIWTHTQILSLQQHPTDRLTGLTAGPRFVGFERIRRRRKEKWLDDDETRV